jgi:hypothetical protein
MILKQITMKSFLFISIVILLFSCKSNAQEQQGLDEFANELSAETFNKMIQSCPIDFEKSKFYQYKYHGYYESFKNAGICRLFEIKDSADFKKRTMKFKKLKNKNVTYIDSNYVYAYQDEQIIIKIPEIEDADEFPKTDLLNEKSIDIYFIEKGELMDVYKNQTSQKYHYSIGLYHYKLKAEFVYWFLIY